MRYTADVDLRDDCITLTDEKDEVTTDFGSEIILAPVDDSLIIVRKLNEYELVVNMLKEHLLLYDAEEDVEYWIQEVLEGLE